MGIVPLRKVSGDGQTLMDLRTGIAVNQNCLVRHGGPPSELLVHVPSMRMEYLDAGQVADRVHRVSLRSMEALTQLISLCGDGLTAMASVPGGLATTLFFAGLAGSMIHCAGMCGPFVLGQVMSDAVHADAGRYGEWHRLAGAALVPYHLGRATTYTALGATAGGATSVFASTASFGAISALLLAIAAGLLLAQALGLALGTSTKLGAGLTRLAGPLSAARGNGARYALGVVLGFLPCGLLYGAFAAAAGTASIADGGIAMAAFALGTVPALVAIAWGGVLARRRLREVARWIAAPLLTGNALVMLALASQRL